MERKNFGRVTIPTDIDVVDETKEIVEKLGADALRDCDGTEFPKELSELDVKIYGTYYTTRKDNKWAKENPDEIQQCYIMTRFITAIDESLDIKLVDDINEELLKINDDDDIYRWWEVIDRTEGVPVGKEGWIYDSKTLTVTIKNSRKFHEYTVSFLAYLIWDPVHMYNSIVNDWKDKEHQITFDVRQPKTKEHSLQRLRKYLEKNPHINVVRFTTFFHQFTLVFDKLKREKYVDWYGYSASVSPYILEEFERQVGYKFRPEYIIDEGYYNNQYRMPSKEFMDFIKFQNKEVIALVREFVDITHEYGREAMMFLGDHWIGVEPFLDEFKKANLDAIVGSVGNGSTLRLISDIEGVKYTEGRFLPYFFPDTFNENGDPVKEAKENWVTARRALLRKPLDRIGYGGYLKLALKFPEFIEYIKSVTDEFRYIYENINKTKPLNMKKVAVLNAWGKMRAWGCHMVHHAIYFKKNYSYSGIIEALSGMPVDVKFISFNDILENEGILEDIDVIINVGDAYTAHGGGEYWGNEKLITAIRNYIFNGGGFIGVGEPSAYQSQGHYFQLANALGVEMETGFTLNYDKYNWDENHHFIIEDCKGDIDFGEGKKGVYALPNSKVIVQKDKDVQLSINEFGKGKSVYISGLPYSFENSRLLLRAIMYASSDEEGLYKWYSSNYNVDVHVYPENGKFCVVNNTFEKQSTTIYRDLKDKFALNLKENEILWLKI